MVDLQKVVDESLKTGSEEKESYDLEYSKRSIVYIVILWAVSLWALATNLSQALWLKIDEKRDVPLKKILWEMGRDEKHVSSFFVDRFSPFNHWSKVGAAGWRSLFIFYNYSWSVLPRLKNNLAGMLSRFWIGGMENRQAVTNRYKMVVSMLADALTNHDIDGEVRILSIASGSAQAVIRAIQRAKQKRPEIQVRVLLIDSDETALNQAKILVSEAGMSEFFMFQKGSYKSAFTSLGVFEPHMVEMIGFLDYLSDGAAVKLITKIRDSLPANGKFFTCNIRNNRERIFLDWVLLWPMIYREKEDLRQVMLEAGFKTRDVSLQYEPFGIHGIVECKK